MRDERDGDEDGRVAKWMKRTAEPSGSIQSAARKGVFQPRAIARPDIQAAPPPRITVMIRNGTTECSSQRMPIHAP
jgi:hypothetical protein